jgi:hypothetical protein
MPVTEAEKRIRLSRRPGIKLQISGTEFACSGLLRRPRLRYKIQCLYCGEVFLVWHDQKTVKCPLCKYSAKMWIMEREFDERSEGQAEA